MDADGFLVDFYSAGSQLRRWRRKKENQSEESVASITLPRSTSSSVKVESVASGSVVMATLVSKKKVKGGLRRRGRRRRKRGEEEVS